MSDKSDKATEKSYDIINELIDAYESVMVTLSSIVGDALIERGRLDDIETFVNKELTDAVTGRNLWQANAKIHKERAEELMVQLQILADQGHRIEVEIPIKAVEV